MADTASRQEALAAKRQKHKEMEEKWVETQIIGFTSWINSFVSKRGKKVESIETAFRDGLMLVDFLELAANTKVEGIDLNPKNKFQCLQNISFCLDFVMGELGVRLLGIIPAAIYDGNLKLILGMIWSVFRSPKITNISFGADDSEEGKKSFEVSLLSWVRDRVVNYGLSVNNFKTSFNDGQVFAALIHSIDPKSLDYETISPSSPAKNLETAFDAALKSLEVPCLLSVEDMVLGLSDERPIALYTSLLFHAWTALGARSVDSQIHAKLQKEKNVLERMRSELASLKAEVAAAQKTLSQHTFDSHGLSEKNEWLRKLLEDLQKKSKVTDDTIHSLETKVNTLNQLGGAVDKKYFRSHEGHRDFLTAGAGGLTGSSTPNDATSTWFVKSKLAEGSEGKVTIHHADTEKALAAGKGGAVLVDNEDGDEAEWTLVAQSDGVSGLKCTKNGEFLQLGKDGKVSFAGDHFAVFDILSENEMTAQEQRARESAGLAKSFKKAGKTFQIRHNASKDFMASGHSGAPALGSTLSDASEWELVLNNDGSVSFRNLKVDRFLNDDGGHISFGDTSAAKADFWFVKGDDGSILLKNKATGDYVSHGGEKVVTCDGQNLETAVWSLVPRDPELAKSLASSLAQAGGVSLLQNALTRGHVNSTPGISESMGKDTEWEITSTDNGNLVFKSKNNGQYLSSSAKGKIGMSGASAPSSQWNVYRGADGDLLLQNCETGEFLSQKGDGALAVVHSHDETNAGWKVKSADGTFTSGSNSSDLALEDGFFMGDGLSVKYLEERNARLNGEIDEAKDKVDREMKRREELARLMAKLKGMGDDNEQRYQEYSKTISVLEEKVDQLQKLFDAEKNRKKLQGEAKAAAEVELLDREAILRNAKERMERALDKLDKSKHSAQKEITKRKQREKEITQLEAMKKQLEQRLVMSERTRVGLESLKRGLEDHLHDLSVWRGHQQMDRQMNDFDLKKISADLEGMPLEEQVDYLDSMLQEENRCLQRISKAQGITQLSETKILKKGTLSLFGKKEWRPRYCVLSGQNLEYYSNDNVKIGVVNLAMGCDVVRLKAVKDGKTKVWPLKLSINVKMKGDEDGEQKQVVKKLFLRASTKAERQSWFTAVSSATSRINYRVETESSGEKIDPRIFSFISAGEATPVYELFVDFRPISSAGINALRKGILYHDELHTLSLQQGQIGDEVFAKLTSWDRLPYLRVLRLSGNRLTSDAVSAALKTLIVQTTGLQEIDLSNNIIGVEAVDALAALLKKNPKVNFLKLSGNVLGDDGALALAKVLQETQAEIPVLEVNNNKIGDKGALALTEMANKNLNIGSILLSGNRVGSDGAVGMAELLRDNVNVTHLDLSGNNIGAKGAQAFRDCLLDNIDLHVVNLSSNPLLCDDEQLSGILHVEGFTIKDLSFVRGKSVKVAAEAQAAAFAAEEDAEE